MEVDEPDGEREGVSLAGGREGSTGTGQSTAGEPQRPPQQGAGGTVYVPVIVPSERVVERVVERVLEKAVPIPVPYPVPQPVPVEIVRERLVPVLEPVLIPYPYKVRVPVLPDRARMQRLLIRMFREMMLEAFGGELPPGILQTGMELLRARWQGAQGQPRLAPPRVTLDMNLVVWRAPTLGTRLASERSASEVLAIGPPLTEEEGQPEPPQHVLMIEGPAPPDSPEAPSTKRAHKEEPAEESQEERRSARARVQTALFQSEEVEARERAMRSRRRTSSL